MARWFIAILFAIVSCACGPAEPPTECRLPDSLATTSQYPYTVRISARHANGKSDRCVGVIISQKTVLTTGHCVNTAVKWTIRSMTGEALTTSTDAIAMSPLTIPNSDIIPDVADVGLIFVETFAKLIAYPELDANSAENASAEIVDTNNMSHPVTLYSGTEYSYHDGASFVIFEWDYFADKVTVPGDSGGPVFARDSHRLLGITHGLGRDRCMSYITRLDKVLPWIKANMR